MRSLNAKRIAAIAASLAIGLVFAGPGLSYSSIPIINSAGQPVVQIVVGGTAMPSDGVVAANIAAVIGNLAFTTTPITASVNGAGNVKCVVTTPSCTLSNQQVWLGEKGTISAVGSYTLKALIGSVLNAGTLNYATLGSTKSLQGSGQYSYFEGATPYPVTSSPNPTSAFAGIGGPLSVPGSVLYNTNGGGVQFTSFSSGTYYDNIVKLSNAQIPGLMSASGPYQETETIWMAGFPVFDQALVPNSFALLNAEAAYQVVFGSPFAIYQNGSQAAASVVKHIAFTFLNRNWTLYAASPPSSGAIPGSGNFVTGTSIASGGSIQLAQAITQQQTVYVGKNITAGPWSVVLEDLSYPTSGGISNAALAVYKNGVLTNTTSLAPHNSLIINVTGSKLYISIGTTFPGLYAYQKWAQIQLFSNVFNLTSGKVWNSTNPGWFVALHWSSNQTASAGTFAYGSAADQNVVLQGIVLYSNQSASTTLLPGSSFTIMKSPALWKVTFAGDSLGTPSASNSNYDALTFQTSENTQLSYTNPLGNGAVSYIPSVTNTLTFNSIIGNAVYLAGATVKVNASILTTASDLFTVTSQLPTGFTITSAGSAPSPSSSVGSVMYDLNTYQLLPQNSVSANAMTNVTTTYSSNAAASPGLWLWLWPLGTNALPANGVSTTNPLTVWVTGYKTGAASATTSSVSFNGYGQNQTIPGFNLVNVTNVRTSSVFAPNGLNLEVYFTTNTNQPGAALFTDGLGVGALSGARGTGVEGNAVLLATYSYNGPYIMYNVPQLPSSQYVASNSVTSTVAYSGQGTNVNFVLTNAIAGNTARYQYFTYNLPLLQTPTATAPGSNEIDIGITNSSSGTPGQPYWLNQSGGNAQAFLYKTNTQGTARTMAAGVGFRSERGGSPTSISTTSATYEMAKSVDTLNFVVGPANSTVSSTTQLFGPYTTGQSTNIANVTIGKVNATCAFSSTSCSITNLTSLTATPSIMNATTSVGLNTAVTPLAVLDSNANQASTLIVVGSKFVNSVAAQIFAQNPTLDSSFNPSSVIVQPFGTSRILVAGYTANQTVQAGNQFIQALLAAASH